VKDRDRRYDREEEMSTSNLYPPRKRIEYLIALVVGALLWWRDEQGANQERDEHDQLTPFLNGSKTEKRHESENKSLALDWRSTISNESNRFILLFLFESKMWGIKAL